MIVVPCSRKTLTGICIGYDSDTIKCAASVSLKERRKLVHIARKTPLSTIDLKNMLQVTKAGVKVFPPVMVSYTQPRDIRDTVRRSLTRMIDCRDLFITDHNMDEDQWSGFDWKSKKSGDAL